MTEPREKYSCDTCHSRKVRCSREQSGCQRCKTEALVCSYSRSGVIRRPKRRRDNTHARSSLLSHTPETPVNKEQPSRKGLREPEADVVGITTEQRVQRLMGSGRNFHSIKAIASLLEEHAAAWQASAAFDRLAEDAASEYFSFEEDQARAWVDELVIILQREKLLLTSIPPEVISHLVASRPHQIPDRAWLVMFYSVALSTSSSNNTSDGSTKAKLRSNLWLAFNDVRLLLEPSILSVLALVVMACYVEEFMTPSICWALISKACIMLQALGISNWRLDGPTRERRTILFWRLNYLDKALGLILCRPPTLHRRMETEAALPTIDQLLPSRSYSSAGASVLFEAHYTNQMHLLSRVMTDVWHCLYGQEGDRVHIVKQSLETWHRKATEILRAAASSERALLSTSGAASVDLALKTLDFHHYSLLLLLTVSSREGRLQSTQPAQQMLNLLPSLGDMKPDPHETFPCLLWQWLHCPSTAFGTLWGEIVIKGRTQPEQSRQSLEAMEHLPTYLGKMRSRNPLAAKLEDITRRFVEHTKSLLYSQGDEAGEQVSLDSTGISDRDVPGSGRAPRESWNERPSQPMVLMTPASMATNTTISPEAETSDIPMDGQISWPDDCFSDPTFDWFAWFQSASFLPDEAI